MDHRQVEMPHRRAYGRRRDFGRQSIDQLIDESRHELAVRSLVDDLAAGFALDPHRPGAPEPGIGS
jgi:hypothetical protein